MPFSECESGRFRTAPIRSPDGLRAGRGPARPDTGSSDRGPARQEAGPSGKRTATGSEGASASEGSGRTGFRPGSCEPGRARRFGAWPVRRNRGFGRGSCRTREREFRLSGSPGQETERKFHIRRAANRQGSGPVGEPPGTPEGLARTDSGGCEARVRPGDRASKPPIAKARFGGTGCEGTVGPGSDAGPHYCLGAVTIGENARRIFTRRVSVSVRTRTFSSAPPRE